MTLIETFAATWQAAPTKVFITLAEERGPRELTGADLLSLARRGAAALAAQGVGPGDRVAIVLPTCEAFLAAFFGTWWLGAAAMPLCPPRGPEDAELMRIGRAIMVAQAKAAVVPPGAEAVMAQAPCPLVSALAVMTAAPSDADPVAPGLAVIQFSSGSTGQPKGAALRDAAIQANLASIHAALLCTPADVGVSWLPLHHDMGLFGTLLYPLQQGFAITLIPTERFIRTPALWIQALGAQKATVTTSPNFGYALAARLPASATEGVDLSPLRAVLAGSEPVRPTTVDNFVRRFAPQGFKPTAFCATYGLAEATLAVTMVPLGEGPRVDRVARGPLETDLVAEPSDAADARILIDNGLALPGVKLALRDDAGADLPERRVGEVHVWSGGLMDGYYNDPAATAALMKPDGWLATGDLGYLANGRLFLVGRIKDMIIRAGRKYHPADLEAIAETDPLVRGGSTACFYVEGNEKSPERIVMLVEPRDPAQAAELPALVRGRVMGAMGLRVDEVVPVAPRSLPKTTSGKVQRGEARKRWLAGHLKALIDA